MMPGLGKKRVFNSVFGAPVISQPTPVATPITRFVAPGEAFGTLPGSHNDQKQQPSDPVRDQIRWDRSWHEVTHVLNLPTDQAHLQQLETSKSTPKFRESLKDILHPEIHVPYASHTEDIITWHTNQVRLHFLREVLPVLRTFDDKSSEILLFRCVKSLETSHRLYLHGLSLIVEELEETSTVDGSSTAGIVHKFRRDLHSIISHSIPNKLAVALKAVLKSYISTILGLPSTQLDGHFLLLPESDNTARALGECLGLVESLKHVGLAGERFQIAFAEVMDDAMSECVYLGFKGIWSRSDCEDQHLDHGGKSSLARPMRHSSSSRCVAELCEWIQDRYAKLATQVIDVIDDAKANPVKVTLTQVEKWQEMAIGHLASLRTNELFDIVEKWPQCSGALDDLRTAITTPQRRLHLTDVFASTLNEKLLHPGTSTLQILQMYISMIRSFHDLDHSKVLLDRVAFPLQLYLCSRDDTVRIIITGLLADTEDSEGNPVRPGGDKLVELALSLNNGQEQLGQRANDEELDWYDMDWMPDPVDAGPGYKRSKSADIIGTLIGVLGSQELFIKEFQNIIGENLLKHDAGFEKEIKVLELLKVRFGEAPLQSCEVMLKDIQDSKKVDGLIRRDQKLDPTNEEINTAQANFDNVGSGHMAPEGMLKPSLHAKILSRLFWPQLNDESYRIPDEVARLQGSYEHGFESLKASRKLTWLHALGQATVELELTDRTISEEVHTWQATVIWEFQTRDEDSESIVNRSVRDLVQHLEMDEALVRSALKFWVTKLVLQETEKDVFTVLETLNQEDRARSNAQAAATAAAAPDQSTDDPAMMANAGITTEDKQMYWGYIQGMLKNASSQMPLQQIAMMLKMLLPNGLPYTNEELQELLNWKVENGQLDFVGGKYKLKK